MQHEQDIVANDCEHLAALHPDYSILELQESQAQLRRYFDLVWKVLIREEAAVEANRINLTSAEVNPMVKPPSGESA
jgi:hypothetical protein